MIHIRLADLPKHLEDELQRILEKMISEGDADDEISDEEFDKFISDNASAELQTILAEEKKAIEAAHARGCLV